MPFGQGGVVDRSLWPVRSSRSSVTFVGWARASTTRCAARHGRRPRQSATPTTTSWARPRPRWASSTCSACSSRVQSSTSNGTGSRRSCAWPGCGWTRWLEGRRQNSRRGKFFFFAVALPPLLPAFFFWAVVPPCDPCDVPEPEWLCSPPFFEAPGEFAILAARSLDMPLSLRASYCFSFLTFAFLLGMASSLSVRHGGGTPFRAERPRRADHRGLWVTW